MKNLIKIIFLLSTSLSLGCNQKLEDVKIPKDYVTKLQPIYLDNYKSEICTSSIKLNNLAVKDILDLLWQHRGSIQFILLGIENSEVTTIDIASSDLCDAVGRNKIEKSLVEIFGPNKIDAVKVLEIPDTDTELDRLGINDINLSLKSFEGPCRLIRPKRLNISPSEVAKTRYTLAVPLVYYNFDNENEYLIFDNNCSSRQTYIDILDRFLKVQ